MRNSLRKVMRWQVISLAWPVVLEMSGVMITGVVTTAMVGRLGAVALTAVGIATMVQFASAMVIAAFGTGASALVGKESGAGQWQQVRRTTGQALLIGLLLGIVLAIIGYVGAESLFLMIGAEPAVVALAGKMLKVLFLVTPVYLLMVISNLFTVGVLVKMLAAGKTVDDVVAAYPELDRQDVLEAIEYAAWAASDQIVVEQLAPA